MSEQRRGKVWVVTHGMYSSTEVVGVFTDYEAALAVAARDVPVDYMTASDRVEEFTLDELRPDTEACVITVFKVWADRASWMVGSDAGPMAPTQMTQNADGSITVRVTGATWEAASKIASEAVARASLDAPRHPEGRCDDGSYSGNPTCYCRSPEVAASEIAQLATWAAE